MSVAIRLYWCRGRGRNDPAQRNFGDYLSPLLVEMLSGKAVRYAPVHRADMMAIGSILPRERKAKRFGWPRPIDDDCNRSRQYWPRAVGECRQQSVSA